MSVKTVCKHKKTGTITPLKKKQPVNPCVCPVGRRNLLANPASTDCPDMFQLHTEDYIHKCGTQEVKCKYPQWSCKHIDTGVVVRPWATEQPCKCPVGAMNLTDYYCDKEHKMYNPPVSHSCNDTAKSHAYCKSVKTVCKHEKTGALTPLKKHQTCVCPVGRRNLMANPSSTECPDMFELHSEDYQHKCGDQQITCKNPQWSCKHIDTGVIVRPWKSQQPCDCPLNALDITAFECEKDSNMHQPKVAHQCNIVQEWAYCPGKWVCKHSTNGTISDLKPIIKTNDIITIG